MNCGERNSGLNTVALGAGIVTAVVVAGIVGRLALAARHGATDKVRDIKDIIAHCQTTIGELDRALHRFQSSPGS